MGTKRTNVTNWLNRHRPRPADPDLMTGRQIANKVLGLKDDPHTHGFFASKARYPDLHSRWPATVIASATACLPLWRG